MVRWAVVVLAWTCSMAVLGAQPRVPAAPARDRRPPTTHGDPLGGARVFGRVLDAETSRPLRAALVVAVPQRSEDGAAITDVGNEPNLPTATRTDADGRFSLTGLAPGEYALVARRTGYVQQQLGQASPQTPGRHLLVQRGAVAGPMEFALTRSAVISGRVLDSTGAPADRVTVRAARLRRLPGGLHPQQVEQATTNDLGEFRVHGLPPGRYVVSAEPARASVPPDAFTTPPERDLLPTFAPAVTAAHEAQVFDVSAGAEVEAHIQLVEAIVSTLTGRVVDSRGEPVTDGYVGLRPRGDSRLVLGATTPVQRDGSFTLAGVPPGAYTITMSPRLTAATPQERAAQLARSEAGMLDVDVRGDLPGLVLRTQPGTTVRGRLVVDGPAPGLQGRDVWVHATPTGPWSHQARARVRPDLTFELAGVRGPAVLRLANAPDGWWTRTVRVGRQDATDGYDFGVARTVTDVEIDVSTRASGLRGRVLTAANTPAVDAVVIGFDQDARRWGRPALANTFMVRPVEDGTWAIDRLRPGRYRLVAVHAAEAHEDGLSDPEYLKALEARARTVMLGEGETPEVPLVLQP